MDALLLYIIGLTLKAGLCLLVLATPPILICATAFNSLARELKYTRRQMVLCNVVVGLAIAMGAIWLPLSTLRTHAITAYIIVAMLLVLFGILALASWIVSLVRAVALSIKRQLQRRQTKQPVVLGQDINASRVRI